MALCFLKTISMVFLHYSSRLAVIALMYVLAPAKGVLCYSLTSHLSTTGCCTQSEVFPTATAFWPSLSPVPSSEWVRLWLPRWPPFGRRAAGLLGGRLSSRRNALFSSSTARTRNSNACRSPAPPNGVDDWASNGESGRGLTEWRTKRKETHYEILQYVVTLNTHNYNVP